MNNMDHMRIWGTEPDICLSTWTSLALELQRFPITQILAGYDVIFPIFYISVQKSLLDVILHLYKCTNERYSFHKIKEVYTSILISISMFSLS